MGSSAREVIELAILGAFDERSDLSRGVDQRGTLRKARVADGDRAVGQTRHLDTVAERATPAALAPLHVELSGRHAVVDHVRHDPYLPDFSFAVCRCTCI